MQERAEVANVAVVVDGRSAAIKAERVAVGGIEGLDLSGESIEELKGHARIRVPRGCGFTLSHPRLLSM